MKIDQFMDELHVRTNSQETLRAYRQDLERFDRFLKLKHPGIRKITRSVIVEYIAFLKKQHGGELTPATINRRLTVISEYFVWLQAGSDKAVMNPVALIKRPQVDNENPSPVEEDEVAKLTTGITDARDRALIALFLFSGLRLHEVAKLNLDTIVPRRRKTPDDSAEFYGFGTVVGKGAKKREFIVGPAAMKALQAYIAAKRLNSRPSDSLFLSSRGTRLSCRAIQQVLDKWCRQLEIDHIRVHQLRHTFATRNVNAGMSMEVLKDLLGHDLLTATQRYYALRSKRVKTEYHAAMEWIQGK